MAALIQRLSSSCSGHRFNSWPLTLCCPSSLSLCPTFPSLGFQWQGQQNLSKENNKSRLPTRILSGDSDGMLQCFQINWIHCLISCYHSRKHNMSGLSAFQRKQNTPSTLPFLPPLSSPHLLTVGVALQNKRKSLATTLRDDFSLVVCKKHFMGILTWLETNCSETLWQVSGTLTQLGHQINCILL